MTPTPPHPYGIDPYSPVITILFMLCCFPMAGLFLFWLFTTAGNALNNFYDPKPKRVALVAPEPEHFVYALKGDEGAYMPPVFPKDPKKTTGPLAKPA